MRKIFASLFLAAVMALGGVSAFAQTQPTRTTITAAIGTIASGQTTTISVSSTTGMTASTNTAQTFGMIDKEIVRIVSLSPFVIARGQQGTKVSAHVNGSEFIYGTTGAWSNNSGNAYGVFIREQPVGSCTRSNQQFLPVFNPNDGNDGAAYNCLVGQWVRQTLPKLPLQTGGRICTVDNLTVLPVDKISGTAGNFYLVSKFVPETRYVTSMYPMWGVTVGSATGFLAGVMEPGGSVIFNTTTAGTASGTASTFQAIAVGTNGYLTGPATYWFFVQGKGTTDGIGVTSINTGSFSALSAGTFGTLGSLTSASITTVFTAGVTSPIVCAGGL